LFDLFKQTRTKGSPAMPKVELTEDQLNRIKQAGIAVHAAICPTRAEHPWNACHTSHDLFGWSMHEAIEHLDQHPRDAKGARRIFHDRVCMSGCEGAGADDHAKTQASKVAALRKHLAA
jgi:hypothetical protein